MASENLAPDAIVDAVARVLLVLLLASPAGAVCTRFYGFSQTAMGYEGFQASSAVNQDEYELVHEGGSGIGSWANPDFSGWDNAPTTSGGFTACASGPVDTVIFTASSAACITDSTQYEDDLNAILVNIRDKHASVTQIYMQPVVGGPSGALCNVPSGSSNCVDPTKVKASTIHPHMRQAIEDVSAEAGNSDTDTGYLTNWVDTCSYYSDAIGHFTTGTARLQVGGDWADHYAGASTPQAQHRFAGSTLSGASQQ